LVQFFGLGEGLHFTDKRSGGGPKKKFNQNQKLAEF
jgi:hypothetical protein